MQVNEGADFCILHSEMKVLSGNHWQSDNQTENNQEHEKTQVTRLSSIAQS